MTVTGIVLLAFFCFALGYYGGGVDKSSQALRGVLLFLILLVAITRFLVLL